MKTLLALAATALFSAPALAGNCSFGTCSAVQVSVPQVAVQSFAVPQVAVSSFVQQVPIQVQVPQIIQQQVQVPQIIQSFVPSTSVNVQVRPRVQVRRGLFGRTIVRFR